MTRLDLIDLCRHGALLMMDILGEVAKHGGRMNDACLNLNTLHLHCNRNEALVLQDGNERVNSCLAVYVFVFSLRYYITVTTHR